MEMALMLLNIAYLLYKKKVYILFFFELIIYMSILYIINFLITYIIVFFFVLARLAINYI